MRSVLLFEPMCSPTTNSEPPLLYVPTSMSPVASEFGFPERPHAIAKEGEVLARYENAFGVYDSHRSFNFPMETIPKIFNPKQKGGSFRGKRGPEPARSVPVTAFHRMVRCLLDK